MAFTTSLEAHFSQINATPAKTDVTIKIFRVTDGGLDAQGNQLYSRTLFLDKLFHLDAGATNQNLIDYFRNQISLANVKFSLGISSANWICNL